ncbi:hypothetical protein TrCOL_g5485 [Triparma columacea]|uniref:Uncharacterized protein n=1 Tax=Triparma columacea TaxID=722753 RepID=A0A9W7LC08_9STRA|nr:hypothetical protein TrCOL_g5485 [Triparma columacea]
MFAPLLFALIPVALCADKTLTQELCVDCSKTELCDKSAQSITYDVPESKCYNPQEQFPDDNGEVWGDFDMMDVCNERTLTRTFYSSTDGSCTNATDSYKLVYETCLGPFGETYPWGVFSCI